MDLRRLVRKLCQSKIFLIFLIYCWEHDQSLAPAKSFACKVEPNLASAAKLLDSTLALYTMLVTERPVTNFNHEVVQSQYLLYLSKTYKDKTKKSEHNQKFK